MLHFGKIAFVSNLLYSFENERGIKEALYQVRQGQKDKATFYETRQRLMNASDILATMNPPKELIMFVQVVLQEINDILA